MIKDVPAIDPIHAKVFYLGESYRMMLNKIKEKIEAEDLQSVYLKECL